MKTDIRKKKPNNFHRINRRLTVKRRKGENNCTSGQLKACSPSNGSNTFHEKNIENEVPYYTLVIRTEQGWRYINPGWDGVSFYLTTTPIMYPESEIPNLGHVWKRIVLDGSINIENETKDGYSLSTIRILEVITKVNEHTSNIFNDDDDYKLAMQRSGVSKLNAEEAKALGLEVEFFQHDFLTDKNFNREDADVIKELMQERIETVSLDKIVDELTKQ